MITIANEYCITTPADILSFQLGSDCVLIKYRDSCIADMILYFSNADEAKAAFKELETKLNHFYE